MTLLFLASPNMALIRASLCHAVGDGDVPLVKKLSKDEDDVEAKDRNGWTILAWAIYGLTALIHASRRGNLEVVKYFLGKAGANMEVQNNEGKTALDVATECSNMIMVVAQHLEQWCRHSARHQQLAEFPTFPNLPNRPHFSSNQKELVSSLEQWVEAVESILNNFIMSLEQWREHQNDSCQSQLATLDDKIAKLERKKITLQQRRTVIQQKNDDMISEATEAAEVSIHQCTRKIDDTREIIGKLGVVGHGPPISLCCPITLQLMTDPVIGIEDGHTYERSAIVEHWRTQEAEGIPATSPYTNKRLLSKQLTPNVLVRSQCLEWLEQNPNWSPEG